jgi:ABC-2 type transport system permease protein
VGAIYKLTLRQLSGRGRLAILALLAAMPVTIAFLMLRLDRAPSVREFEGAVLSAMFAGAIIPLMLLALAGVAFSNEVEDRTLANIFLSPVSRWRIALPKLLASLTVASPFVIVSAALTGHIAYVGDWTATIALVTGMIVAVVLYASAFTWLGLVTTQAIGFGLLYVVIWEGLFSGFVAGVRLLSLRHYALAIVKGLDPRRFANLALPELAVVLGLCALVVGGFAWLTVRRLRRMDVP